MTEWDRLLEEVNAEIEDIAIKIERLHRLILERRKLSGYADAAEMLLWQTVGDYQSHMETLLKTQSELQALKFNYEKAAAADQERLQKLLNNR